MPTKTILSELNGHENVIVVEDQRSSSSAQFLATVSDIILLALIFLFPLFAVLKFPDAVELPKQLLLLSLSTLLGILWIIRVFILRSIVVRKTFLFFPVILYVVWFGIATVTSIDRYTSLFGGVSGEYASLASLVGFFLLLFFIANHPLNAHFVRKICLVLLGADIIVALFYLLKILGAASNWPIFIALSNSVGSVYGLAVFLAGILTLACGLLLFDAAAHKEFLPARSGIAVRALAITVGLLNLAVLSVLDWSVGWILVLAGVVPLLAFVFIYASLFKNLARLLLPFLAFVVAVLLLFFRSPVPSKVPVEISPNQKVSWEVMKEVIREKPAFGSGPSTYSFEYAKYRPKLFMSSPFWNTRFNNAASFVLTLLPTVGLIGGILWLLLVFMTIGFAVRTWRRESNPDAWLLNAVIFFPWLMLVVSRFLYNSNMVLEFLFWLLTALLIVTTSRKLGAFAFSASPRALLGTSLGAVVFVVLMVILLLLGVYRAGAWAVFAGAVKINDQAKARELMVRSARLDPRNDIFARNLAQVRLLEAPQAKTIEELRNFLNAAVVSGEKAVALGPANSQNWILLGSVYREMTQMVKGAGEKSISAFEKARSLEPNSPVYSTEIGRVHIMLADAAKKQTQSKDDTVRRAAEIDVSNELVDASRALNEAIELKSDYAPAHFYLALVLERQGKLDEAIAKMESARNFNARDIGVAFQLSLLYIEDKQLEKAEAELKRALQISPNYANAHWYLASIYESRGKIDAAVAEVREVLKTNPDSTAVKDRLNALQSGKASQTLPAPVEGETRQ